MFEAVGEENWSTFFAKIGQALKPGGRAAMQVITVRDDLFDGYRGRVDFIQRYIFPGGKLPSLARLRDEGDKVGLAQGGTELFAGSYAQTLAEWSRVSTPIGRIARLGFDARFKRLWHFYLSYCEAGFRTGRTDVVDLHFEKPR